MNDRKNQVNGQHGVLFSFPRAVVATRFEKEQVSERKKKGDSFNEVLRIIRLLHSISIRPLLHTLGVIVISAVTATPCSLGRKSAQLSDLMRKYKKGNITDAREREKK